MPTEINSTNILEVIQTNPKIRFNSKDPAPDVKPFRLRAVEILDENQWAVFSNRLLDDYDFIAKHSDALCVGSDGITNALLVLNKQTEEGILVNSEGSSYARYSAYLPFAGHMLDYYVNMIADYCVTEGTLNTSDGAWAISFDELYGHHNEVDITEGNGIDELVLRELQMRDEVAEAIQTEDGYEIAYHLEHCPQCNAGGIEAGFSLLSLLGCTLQDVHFIEKDGSDMLAYISMHKNGWENHSYVALCSTADRAALQMLKDNPHLKTVYLCLDNDNAGLLGCKRVADSIHQLGDYTVWRVVPQNKDWDEDLKALHGREAIPSDDITPNESTNNIDLTM